MLLFILANAFWYFERWQVMWTPFGSREKPQAAWILVAVVMLANLVLPISAAQAQRQTITVLIEASYEPRGKRFLEDLNGRLQPAARDSVSFDARVASSAEMPALLRDSSWDMTIVSTAVLAAMSARTNATAFEIPFLFTSTQNAIDLQQGPIGRAGLSTLTPQGMTGFVYLNAGITLMAGRNAPRSPDDLKGLKVGVFTTAQQQTFQTMGSSPVIMPPTATPDALRTGAIDSATISSGNPATWQLTGHRFLLADSVKAQVAVVATRNERWDRLPFVLRAMIGDAAIAATEQSNRSLLEAESSLFSQVRQANIDLVNFQTEDASRATRQWIDAQPGPARDYYSTLLDQVKKASLQQPTPPPTPRRGGQAGRLYFATTRAETNDASIAYRFGDARTDTIKCGQIEYSVSNLTAEGAAFAGPMTTGNAACGTKIDAILRSGKRVLIFVHGFNNRFSEAAESAMILKNALGSELEVVLWSWPSKRDGWAGSYEYDKEAVTGIARQVFLEFLKSLKDGSTAAPLSILAHSMGGWHTLGALVGLSSDAGRPVLDNVAMAAPDVPVDEFMLGLPRMRAVTKRVSLYACGSDRALEISQSMNDYSRAGTGGANKIIASDGLESIDVEGKWISTNHSYVFEAGKVLSDLALLMTKSTDAGARGLTKQSKSTWYYWIFP